MTASEQPKPDEQPELKEYHYYVGYIEHTAQLTEDMAEKLGAKPLDQPLDEPATAKTPLRGSVLQSGGVEKSRRARDKQV